ncbi:GNAT family N-acetyltransferase [Roseovarius aquimarinus]|uniref:GNAT family N-acetyltransferase n=1 Tax=Roseovarius aquimarinus TaxID=1229156 RepID=A0ABW7I457_9RHOB
MAPRAEGDRITLREATGADAAAIVAMNAAVVDVTSEMDVSRLAHLLEICTHAIVAEKAGDAIGFVLAMEQGAPYENANFAWFSERLNNFVYIDRIVIAPEGRGAGLGRALYAHVETLARRNGRLVMAAEMDIDPPNTPSMKFHEAAGFVELGQRRYDSGKVVSMQIKGF